MRILNQWVFGKTARARNPNEFTTYKEARVANTLNLFDIGGAGLRANELVVEFVDEDLPTFAIEGNGCRPSHLGSGISTPDGKMFTVNTTEVHGVMYWENDDESR